MELVTRHRGSAEDSETAAERAFLVGMLSVAEALLGRPLETLMQELRIPGEVAEALMLSQGDLGRLLDLVLSVEAGDTAKFGPELGYWKLSFNDLQRLDNEAFAWVDALAESLRT